MLLSIWLLDCSVSSACTTLLQTLASSSHITVYLPFQSYCTIRYGESMKNSKFDEILKHNLGYGQGKAGWLFVNSFTHLLKTSHVRQSYCPRLLVLKRRFGISRRRFSSSLIGWSNLAGYSSCHPSSSFRDFSWNFQRHSTLLFVLGYICTAQVKSSLAVWYLCGLSCSRTKKMGRPVWRISLEIPIQVCVSEIERFNVSFDLFVPSGQIIIWSGGREEYSLYCVCFWWQC